MRTGVLLAVAFTALVSTGCCKGGSGGSSSAPSLTVDATGIYQEYETDRSAADKKYLGKRIRVSGVVSSVGDDDDKLTVYLQGGAGPYDWTIIHFGSEFGQKIAELSKGASLVADCTGDGSAMGPQLKECSLQSSMTVAATPPAMTVTAAGIYAEYSANNDATDKKYMLKRVRITGVVSRVGSRSDDSPTLYLQGGSGLTDWTTLEFRSEYASKVSALSKGASITAECTGDRSIGGPRLSECIMK